MENEPETCDGSEHLIHEERKDMELPDEAYQFWCGHDDLFTPGINTPDAGEFSNFIGFMPVIPDWCPLRYYKQLSQEGKEPVAYYAILKWNKETIKYDTVFYCEDHKQYEQQAVRFPEADGFKHFVEYKYVVGHTVQLELKAMRDKAKAEVAAQLGVK